MFTSRVWLLALLSLASGLFVSPYVKNIPHSQLRKFITSSDFLSAVITYADDTPLCKDMEPHLLKVAETYMNFMRTYAVECHTMIEPKCTPEMAAKLPGLQLYFPYGYDEESGQTLLYQDRYTGQLTMKAFGDYLIGKMPYYGNILTSETFDMFMKYPGLNKTILFTDKDQVPGLLKAMSAQFRARLDFGLVWKNQTDLVEKYDIKYFPTLLTFSAGRRFEYDGELNFDDLKWYLNFHASKERLEDRLKLSPYNSTEESKPANKENYTSTVEQADKTVVTMFYEGEIPQTWTDWRYLYQGMVTFLEVNCAEDAGKTVAKRYQVDTFPTYILHPLNKSQPIVQVTQENISEVLKSQYKGGVVDIDTVKRQEVMDFMKADERVMSVLVADELLPQFQAIANDTFLRQYVVFAHSRLQKDYLFGQVKIQNTPAIVSMRVMNESDLHVLEYNGRPDDFNNLKYYYEENAVVFYHNYSRVMEKEDYEDEIIDELYTKSFHNLCGRKSSYCAIAFLDGEFKSKKNKEALNLMRKVKVYSEQKSRAIRFSWVDAKCEFELRKSLSIKEKDLPALVFFQGGNFNRIFNYTGGWDEIKMRQEVDKLEAGKVTTGTSAVFQFTDRDCDSFHKEIETLLKANPDTTKQRALEEFLEKEQKLHAEGQDKTRGKKRKSKKADL